MRVSKPVNKGILYGLLATFVMTFFMTIGMSTGQAPMPKPIPTALAELFLGAFLGSVSVTVATVSGMVAHFGYGAGAGAVFSVLFGDTVDWKRGLLWGGVLWLIMQIAVLPLIGWGIFGLAETGFPPKIAVGTLVLHLVYGLILGWGCSR